ncbi:MFS transporter [Bacillus sp. V2I10]|uniref:MFS transporter n=1 Tax=Bacillus sp. V2I10 TaxID=3042276 RepID=UPI0027838F59|nr:MFS transporter [Bacillus sp. V2I10]MDQ0862267.1 ACS family hexuronate transporter-like MFS transporter [Bacillus sp. V2I10]
MFKKYRWFIVFLLFLAGAFNYMDRVAFSVAAPFISKEFNLTPTQLGLLFSSFFIGYAIFNFIGGYLADRFGPRKVFGGSLGLWSIFIGATAVTFNFTSLYISRLFFGFAEGPVATTSNKMVNNWFPAKERASAIGIYTAGMPLGGAIAAPLVGLVSIQYGWRTAFIVLMILGLLLAYFWMKLTKDHPKQHPKVSEAELMEIQLGQGTGSDPSKTERVSLWKTIKHPTILFTAVAFFAYNYNNFFFLTWFPSYLTDAKNLSVHDMSIVTVIPWLVGAIGLFSGGFISDYIYKKTKKLMFSRKIILVTGLFGAAICVGFVVLVETAAAAVALMAIAVFFLYLTAMIYWAIIQDTVPSNNVGTAGGFIHLISNISGIIAPTVTGYFIESTGTFNTAFFLAASLAIFGSLAVVFFVKPIKTEKGTANINTLHS